MEASSLLAQKATKDEWPEIIRLLPCATWEPPAAAPPESYFSMSLKHAVTCPLPFCGVRVCGLFSAEHTFREFLHFRP